MLPPKAEIARLFASGKTWTIITLGKEFQGKLSEAEITMIIGELVADQEIEVAAAEGGRNIYRKKKNETKGR